MSNKQRNAIKSMPVEAQNKKEDETMDEETKEVNGTQEMTFEELQAQNAKYLAIIQAYQAERDKEIVNTDVKPGKFETWKANHPKATKVIHKVGVGLGLVGAWMLGGAVQAKKDAKEVQTAIDDGVLIRAEDLDKMTAEAETAAISSEEMF